jgi:hypothetical protein
MNRNLEGPLERLVISSRFINKHGCHRQFFFLIGPFLKIFFHRCFLPSFGSFGQEVSEEKIFLNRPIRNNNCLWWPCLLMDRDKISAHHHYSGKVNFMQWSMKRKLKQWWSTIQLTTTSRLKTSLKKRPWHMVFACCLWQGELKTKTTIIIDVPTSLRLWSELSGCESNFQENNYKNMKVISIRLRCLALTLLL